MKLAMASEKLVLDFSNLYKKLQNLKPAQVRFERNLNHLRNQYRQLVILLDELNIRQAGDEPQTDKHLLIMALELNNRVVAILSKWI